MSPSMQNASHTRRCFTTSLKLCVEIQVRSVLNSKFHPIHSKDLLIFSYVIPNNWNSFTFFFMFLLYFWSRRLSCSFANVRMSSLRRAHFEFDEGSDRMLRSSREERRKKNVFPLCETKVLTVKIPLKSQSFAKLYHVLIYWNQRPIASHCLLGLLWEFIPYFIIFIEAECAFLAVWIARDDLWYSIKGRMNANWWWCPAGRKNPCFWLSRASSSRGVSVHPQATCCIERM